MMTPPVVGPATISAPLDSKLTAIMRQRGSVYSARSRMRNFSM